jgi:hypothetical protein
MNTQKKKGILCLIAPIFLLLFGALACGGGGSKPNNTPTTVAVTSVSLDKTTLALNVGSSDTLTATVQPSNASNKNLTWASSSPAVATVNNGLVIPFPISNVTDSYNGTDFSEKVR